MNGEPVSSEKTRAILEQRARLLARVPARPATSGPVLEVATFALGAERYALETEFLCEVVRPREIVPLPGAPPQLLGITHVRGQILPVFDLARLLGVSSAEPSDQARLMVLGRGRMELGVVADAVIEVARVASADILEPPATVASAARALMHGVTAASLIVLKGASLLADPRLIVDLR